MAVTTRARFVVLAAAAFAVATLAGSATPVGAIGGGAGTGTPGPILFVRDDDAIGGLFPQRLYTLVPGGLPVVVPNSDGALDARWSPDGRVIAFTTWDRGLFLINPDGSGLRSLFTPAEGEHFGTPLWSPDGSRIAFSVHTNGANFHIETADSLDGTREVLPTDLAGITDWAADGTFWGLVQVNANGIDREDVGWMSPDGVTHKLTDTDAILEGAPRLSPDGTKVAFVSTTSTLDEYRIELMNVDGTGRRTLATAPSASWPAWSPDGIRIVYVYNAVPKVVNIVTGNRSELIEDYRGTREGFDWAPLPDTVAPPAAPASGTLETASYTGIRALALPDPSTIAYVSTTTSSIWPSRDGYRDTLTVRLRMKEPARSRVDVFNSAGTRVKTASFGWRTGLFTWKWTGRTSYGSILPSGTYRVTLVAKDLHGNIVRKTVTVKLYRGAP